MKSLLLPLTEPVAAIWLLMLVLMAYWLGRKKWNSGLCMALPVGLLWLAGTSPIPTWVVGSNERPYARPVPEAPTDVVVVLGGGYYASDHDAYGIALVDATSRIVTGIELARHGVTTNLVLGGSIPVNEGQNPLSSRVQTWVESFSLHGVGITNLGNCYNTHDEALSFKRLRDQHGWKSVYLVTSALHMPRSVALFEKQGISVTPVACDFQVYGTRRASFTLFPSSANLRLLALYTHERIGWWVYRLRGWI